MPSHPKQKATHLFLNKLLGISFLLFFGSGCFCLSKKIPMNSQNLILKIQWDYSSPLEKKKNSFLSLVSVHGDRKLRLDIIQTFIGSVGGFILNGQNMLLLAPFQKQYYKSVFDSKVFFPDFPSFSGLWIIALLRAKPPEHWKCQNLNKKLSHCQTEHFEIRWEYSPYRLENIHIRDSKQRQITAQIKSLSSYKLSDQLFDPELESWEMQTDPLFFQQL